MYKEVLCTRQCLNNVQNCQKQKRKEDSDSNLVKTLGMREANTYLVTNQILYPCWSHIEPKKINRKGKGQDTKKPKFPPKSGFLKTPIGP